MWLLNNTPLTNFYLSNVRLGGMEQEKEFHQAELGSILQPALDLKMRTRSKVWGAHQSPLMSQNNGYCWVPSLPCMYTTPTIPHFQPNYDTFCFLVFINVLFCISYLINISMFISNQHTHRDAWSCWLSQLIHDHYIKSFLVKKFVSSQVMNRC